MHNFITIDPLHKQIKRIHTSYLDKTSLSLSSVHVYPKFAIKIVKQGGISLEDLSRPSYTKHDILSSFIHIEQALNKKHQLTKFFEF